MKHALGALLLLALCSCTSNGIVEHRGGDLIGLDSFALAPPPTARPPATSTRANTCN